MNISAEIPVPAVEEILDDAVVVSLPMNTRFRGQTAREVLLFRGPQGWAEFGPFPEYGPEESANWLRSGVEAAWQGLGEALRTEIPVNATIPAVAADEVEGVVSRYRDPQAVPAVKIKVAEPGQDLADDLARVAEVHRILPNAGLRVDANGAWNHQEAVTALGQIAEIAGERFEYAEQPVAGIEPLAELREALDALGIPVKIAADEAVRKSADPLRVAQLGAAELIVVKAPPLGGIGRALAVVQESGLDAVVSSALDTSVGLSAGIALASRLPRLPYACGLGTVTMFSSDVVTTPLVPRAGKLPVLPQAPAPDPELLAAHRVTGDREQWWHQRVEAAYQHLSGTAASVSVQ